TSSARARKDGGIVKPSSLARRFLHVSHHAFSIGFFALTSRAITAAWGTSSETSSSRLGISSVDMRLTPGRLPPGRARLATRPISTGSPTLKAIGMVEVAVFAASDGGVPLVTITSTPWTRRSAANAADRSTVFDRHILSIDVAGFAEPLIECGYMRRIRIG